MNEACLREERSPSESVRLLDYHLNSNREEHTMIPQAIEDAGKCRWIISFVLFCWHPKFEKKRFIETNHVRCEFHSIKVFIKIRTDVEENAITESDVHFIR